MRGLHLTRQARPFRMALTHRDTRFRFRAVVDRLAIKRARVPTNRGDPLLDPVVGAIDHIDVPGRAHGNTDRGAHLPRTTTRRTERFLIATDTAEHLNPIPALISHIQVAVLRIARDPRYLRELPVFCPRASELRDVDARRGKLLHTLTNGVHHIEVPATERHVPGAREFAVAFAFFAEGCLVNAFGAEPLYSAVGLISNPHITRTIVAQAMRRVELPGAFAGFPECPDPRPRCREHLNPVVPGIAHIDLAVEGVIGNPLRPGELAVTGTREARFAARRTDLEFCFAIQNPPPKSLGKGPTRRELLDPVVFRIRHPNITRGVHGNRVSTMQLPRPATRRAKHPEISREPRFFRGRTRHRRFGLRTRRSTIGSAMHQVHRTRRDRRRRRREQLPAKPSLTREAVRPRALFIFHPPNNHRIFGRFRRDPVGPTSRSTSFVIDIPHLLARRVFNPSGKPHLVFGTKRFDQLSAFSIVPLLAIEPPDRFRRFAAFANHDTAISAQRTNQVAMRIVFLR